MAAASPAPPPSALLIPAQSAGPRLSSAPTRARRPAWVAGTSAAAAQPGYQPAVLRPSSTPPGCRRLRMTVFVEWRSVRILRMRRIIITFLALALATALSAQELPAEMRASIDKAANDILAKTGAPSASIAVVRDGKIVYTHA